jgi:hypothetical protein
MKEMFRIDMKPKMIILLHMYVFGSVAAVPGSPETNALFCVQLK